MKIFASFMVWLLERELQIARTVSDNREYKNSIVQDLNTWTHILQDMEIQQ